MESLFPEVPPVKRCYKCRLVKPHSEFYLRKKGKDAGKLKSECIECAKSTRHSWYLKNKDHVHAYATNYKKQNPEWYAAWLIRNRKEKPERHKHNQLLMSYGIGLPEYERMVAEQNGLCAICKQPQDVEGRPALSVDHDHATRKVRGLLCSACNFGLGKFKDDPERLRAAARYLEEHGDP